MDHMNSEVIVAIVAFVAGVIVAALSGWLNQRMGRRKHLAQLASAAFIDGVKAITENVQCQEALMVTDPSEEEKSYWRRRSHETRATYYAAKARFITYGNSEAGALLIELERQGNISTGNQNIPALAAKIVLSLRKELGFKKDDISETEISSLLFGPTILGGEPTRAVLNQ